MTEKTEQTIPLPSAAIETIRRVLHNDMMSMEVRDALEAIEIWSEDVANFNELASRQQGYRLHLRDVFHAWAHNIAQEPMSYAAWLENNGQDTYYYSHDIGELHDQLEDARDRACTAESQLEDKMMTNYHLQYLDAMKRLGALQSKLSLLEEWMTIQRALVQVLSKAALYGSGDEHLQAMADVIAHTKSIAIDQGDRLTLADITQAVREGRFLVGDKTDPADIKRYAFRLMFSTGMIAHNIDNVWPLELAGPTKDHWNSMTRSSFLTHLVDAMTALLSIANEANIDLAQAVTDYLMTTQA